MYISKRNCNKCGKYYEGRGKKFCSNSCSSIGRKHKKETIDKMKKTAIGRKNPRTPEWTEKIANKLRGKKRPPFSAEWIENMTKSRIGRKSTMSEAGKRRQKESVTGARNKNWKGGKTSVKLLIRNSDRYDAWRRSVFTRDNWTCQECKVKSGKIEAHHIKAISLILHEYNIKNLEESYLCEELWDVNNGQTLCRTCHKKTDNYGLKALKHNKSNSDKNYG